MNQRLALLALIAGTTVLALAIAFRQTVNPWWANGAGALLIIPLAALALRETIAALLRPRALAALLAALIGAAMVAATHLGFHLATKVFPPFGESVAALYANINRASPGLALIIPLIVIVVLAEELLWRGVAFGLARERLSVVGAGAASVFLYALPQLLAQAWVLALAALLVGAVFTVQRIKSERILEPIITHAVWSISIFALFPLL